MGAEPAMQTEMMSLCPGCDARSILDQAFQRRVYLDAYWIDQTEVTTGQFRAYVEAANPVLSVDAKGSLLVFDFSTKEYCKATGINWTYINDRPADFVRDRDIPVTHVSWLDARGYCEWTGRRLPTEAQWEKASRGTGGQFFPWGDALPDNSYVNFNLTHTGPVAVKSYPAGVSPYGAYDMPGMCGNGLWIGTKKNMMLAM